jgi:succinate dehydrogenase/fumarate reductase flavoprotein subunit
MGSQQVSDLVEFGINFRRHEGELIVGQAPGHTYPRHFTAEAYRGINITRPMRKYAESIGAKFIEGLLVTRLLQSEGAVVGVLGIDDKGQTFVINAKSTILATGGGGQIYLRTNNSAGLTGDGYALAYQAGATLRDMEFVQFYPTTWGKQGSKICVYEWLLPIGAILRNSLDEDILKKYGMHNISSVTRDILTRTVMKEIIEGRGIEGNIVVDFATIPEEEAQTVYRGAVIGKEVYLQKLPVAPAVHFFMGGIRINESSETGINGLYAAGEVCGGIHGANRLGGNAISETLAFGTIAGKKAAAMAEKMEQIPTSQNEITAEVERLKELQSGTGQQNLEQLQQSLKQTMWDRVGIIRDRQNLERTQKEILALREQLAAVSPTDHQQLRQTIKLANMLTVSEMVCRSALMRTESRGAHYRIDYPEEDNRQWLKTIEISCLSGEMILRVE